MTKKRIFSFFLIFSLVLLFLPAGVRAENDATQLLWISGGDNITIELFDNGLLEVRGKGEMWDFMECCVPNEYKSTVRHIAFEDGISYIGRNVFSGLPATYVKLPLRLERVGDYAFKDCKLIKSPVVMPDKIKHVGIGSFEKNIPICASLGTVGYLYARSSGNPFFKNLKFFNKTQTFLERRKDINTTGNGYAFNVTSKGNIRICFPDEDIVKMTENGLCCLLTDPYGKTTLYMVNNQSTKYDTRQSKSMYLPIEIEYRGTYIIEFFNNTTLATKSNKSYVNFFLAQVDVNGNYTTAVWRSYNKITGEHVFTGKYSEYAALEKLGWISEGVAFVGLYASDEEAIPVFRAYNPNAGDHIYTASREEYDMVVEAGWKPEGPMFYVPKEGYDIYRVYNPNAITGTHHYTSNVEEYYALIKKGWIDEGAVFSAIEL